MSFFSFESNHESASSELTLSSEKISDLIVTNPFRLKWSFGLNSSVPVINLSTQDRSLVAYACSHVTMLYDYKSHKMFPLRGHCNYVRSLSVNITGKWLLTADIGNNSTVIVWDTENRIPTYTLFNPHEDKGMVVASISLNARYVITVGNENIQLVKLWLWTIGRQVPEASTEITESSSDSVKEIAFSYENFNLFALTKDHEVLFFTWNEDSKKLSLSCPSIFKKPSKLGSFNNTSFISRTTKVFTGTVNGFVLVWDVDNKNISEDAVTMKHINSIQLQKANITKIVNHLGMVVTGNSLGHINIYDSNLKILYWCRNFGLDSISSISFDFRCELLSCPINFKEESDSKINFSIKKESETEYNEKDKECNKEMNKLYEQMASNITAKIEYPPRPKTGIKSVEDEAWKFKVKFEQSQTPRDVTLHSNALCIDKFIVATLTGKLAWVDVSTLKYRFISNYCESLLTAIDAHPKSDYMVIANKTGTMFLFNYTNHRLMLKKNIRSLPELLPILKNEVSRGKIIHITNTKTNKTQSPYSTVLKYSPAGDALIAGTENGALWVLHPDTLDILDPDPFKHSNGAIMNIIFSECSNFIAYFDDTMTVVVLKRSGHLKKPPTSYYDFIGKHRSHHLPIKDILFGPSKSDSKAIPCLLTIGEDRVLVEYDLSNSGPYPDPGLVILQVKRIEQDEIPLCMAWYSRLGAEKFLVTSNSDFKFKLIHGKTKETVTTVLGPRYKSPVKRMVVKETETLSYMIFITDKEIGLQILPFDGNPYKIIGMVGHPQKISWMRVSCCGKFVFTVGCDDHCALMWKINFRSADVVHRIGGIGLSPFYGLINGGKKGWLFNEMQDLFIFAQILQEGENSMKTRQIGDYVLIEQLPKLIRAIGFYPTYEQLGNLMREVSYESYGSVDKFNKKRISFEEFVNYYINHRPAYGISMKQLQDIFRIFGKQQISEDFTLSKRQFIDILRGKATSASKILNETYGDSLTVEEVETYLKHLMLQNSSETAILEKTQLIKTTQKMFEILPNHISYKDFSTNIMGIESLKETRADSGEM